MTPRPLRFVVFAAPRTGSNLLCSLLDAHPDILCHRGLFNPAGIHCTRDLGDSGGVAGRDRDPAAFLDAVWAAGGGAQAIGFKMNRDEDERAVAALLRDPGIRKILLRRRNRVRTYVSEEIARRTGIWESFAPSAAPIPAIRVEPRALLHHVDLNTAYYAGLEAVLAATGQDWLQTDYEALADGDEIARILAFLGVEARSALPAACHKRGPSDLGAVVENFGALAEALAGTALLDDLYRRDAPDIHVHDFAG